MVDCAYFLSVSAGMQKDTLINRFLEGTLTEADDLHLEARLEALTLVPSADMIEFRTKFACFRKLYMPGDNYKPESLEEYLLMSLCYDLDRLMQERGNAI